MKSKTMLFAAAVALIGTTAFVTAHVVRAQQKQDTPSAFDPAMMAKMMELATPGKEHQRLAERAGKWDLAYKMRMSPDAPWMETSGTDEAKMILGGRYLVEEIRCSMMGMPMESILITGFDKKSGEYIGFWADSMSTWWVTSRGKGDANGVIETKGTMVDIAGERPFRMVVRPNADGTVDTEMYDTIPPHGEVQVMTVRSTRKK